jgi:hypothetical protein
MPVLTNEPVTQDPSMAAKLAEWVIQYGRDGVAYQHINNSIFVYRIPTLGEMLDLEIAEAQHQFIAANLFLKKIGLSTLPRTKPKNVLQLLQDIVKEHFPTSEVSIAADLLYSYESYGNTLVGAIEAHLKEINADVKAKDLTYKEVIKLLTIKQMLTQKPIMPGSMPKKKPRERKNHNVQQKETTR